MASKKRKKSYAVQQKQERARQEQKNEKSKQMKKNVIIAAAIALAVALIIALISVIIYKANDCCDYKKTLDLDGHTTYTATINVKGYGTIEVLLDRDAAPITVDNFVKLANDGFYDGLTFHRVIEGFMIQGGDPNADGTGGNTDAEGNKLNIKGEFSSNGHTANSHLKHIRGVISMARGNDMNSASSQFFIMNADKASLDGNYAAFGFVTSGLGVVDKITGRTAIYGDSNGAISVKGRQAVITSIRVEKN